MSAPLPPKIREQFERFKKRVEDDVAQEKKEREERWSKILAEGGLMIECACCPDRNAFLSEEAAKEEGWVQVTKAHVWGKDGIERLPEPRIQWECFDCYHGIDRVGH